MHWRNRNNEYTNKKTFQALESQLKPIIIDLNLAVRGPKKYILPMSLYGQSGTGKSADASYIKDIFD